MKKTPLILTVFFSATCAFAGNCGTPVKSAPDTNFTIMQDNKGKYAVEIVSFCETSDTGGTDYVVDLVMLGKENNQINLFIHEFVASSPTAALTHAGWWYVDKDLTDPSNPKYPDEIQEVGPNGNCLSPGDYTRYVKTGSGVENAKKNMKKSKRLKSGGAFRIELCGHGQNVKYDIK